MLHRRGFLQHSLKALGLLALAPVAAKFAGNATAADKSAAVTHIEKTEAEWKALLTPQQYNILREEGTERPFTSPLNNEKHEGIFACAGCDLPLFPSRFKYDSGTGWPSFYDAIPGHLETKTDRLLLMARTEYHCARCGGHHGHRFEDGPKPTGLRYCSNGAALKFIPKA